MTSPIRPGPGDPDTQLLPLHSARGRIALTATVLASSAALLDSTIANVALPKIGLELGGDLGALLQCGCGCGCGSLVVVRTAGGNAQTERIGRLQCSAPVPSCWMLIADVAALDCCKQNARARTKIIAAE